MQIKREGEPTFIPVVITLEHEHELQALLKSVELGYQDSPPGSNEEAFLDNLKSKLSIM